jgi:deoxyribonuclease V
MAVPVSERDPRDARGNRVLGPWPRSARAAIALQRELAGQVRLVYAPLPARIVGLDCAFSGDEILAVAVVWDTAAGAILEVRAARRAVRFPYVPGLLSFREVPVLERVLERVRTTFGGILCDGQGIAHPRRFGLASHLGLRLGLPTVGCAKSRLCGRHGAPGPLRGDWSPLLAEVAGDGSNGASTAGTVANVTAGAAGRTVSERIGTVLRTRDRVSPMFVSPGHLTDHPSSVEWVLACGRGYRLPEPVRQADRLVGEYKRAGRLPRIPEAPLRVESGRAR